MTAQLMLHLALSPTFTGTTDGINEGTTTLTTLMLE